jgi:hypothetical protein
LQLPDAVAVAVRFQNIAYNIEDKFVVSLLLLIYLIQMHIFFLSISGFLAAQEADLTVFNPLSLDSNNPWERFHRVLHAVIVHISNLNIIFYFIS